MKPKIFSITDITTNSSSELFVMKTDKEDALDYFRELYSDFQDFLDKNYNYTKSIPFNDETSVTEFLILFEEYLKWYIKDGKYHSLLSVYSTSDKELKEIYDLIQKENAYYYNKVENEEYDEAYDFDSNYVLTEVGRKILDRVKENGYKFVGDCQPEIYYLLNDYFGWREFPDDFIHASLH